MALQWRIEFFLTSNRFSRASGNISDSRIRVLSSVTQDPLEDPRYFHLSDLIQFGSTSKLLRSWEIVLEKEPSSRELGRRYSLWKTPFANNPMAKSPEQAFSIALARNVGIEVALDKSGAVKSHCQNLKNYFSFVQKHIEVLNLLTAGIATEQARFYRPDHSCPTGWQHEVPSRLLHLKSRFGWALTKSGAAQALF